MQQQIKTFLTGCRIDRFEARKKVVAWFEENGLMEKIEDYQNKVGYSERGAVPIEPYLSNNGL